MYVLARHCNGNDCNREQYKLTQIQAIAETAKSLVGLDALSTLNVDHFCFQYEIIDRAVDANNDADVDDVNDDDMDRNSSSGSAVAAQWRNK